MNRYLLSQSITISAQRCPEKEAVRFSGQSLTYGELERRSNSLARVLVERGVKRGDRVGIYMNKALESPVALYGIMKAGGAYVPLDPFAPLSRIAHVIRDCGIRHLITSDLKMSQVEGLLAKDIEINSLIGVSHQDELPLSIISWEDVLTTPSHPLGLNLTELDLAYILYTSGSTGVPKGIMHTHRSGLSFAEWGVDTYGLTHRDRLSNHAPLHFDLSTFDFFAGALAAATTIIIPEALTKFPADLSSLIEQEEISIWYSVPYALIQLMQRGNIANHDLGSLRWILFAGEVFPTKHLRCLMEMLPDVQFSNLYGPTETNVCTCYHVEKLPQSDDETIPIGEPCANIQALVVDQDDQPVPIGEVGELLIRGGVVMRGYWGQPEKTRQGFFRRPAFDHFEDVFYRTGDLVQLDEAGNYRYLGRKDRQIKTRGYRVELDEIEVALLTHPNVQEVAVYPIPDGQGSNLVEASVILKENENTHEAELMEHIAERLPSYAVPVNVHILDAFPRTSTGKVNRRVLQEQAAAFPKR